MYSTQDYVCKNLIENLSCETPSNIFSYYPFLDMFDYTIDEEYPEDEDTKETKDANILIINVLNPNWKEEVDRIKVKTLSYIFHIFDKNLNNLKNYINDTQLRSYLKRHDVVC
jgi:hypothetical protein